MADDITVASGNNTSPPNGTKFATDEVTGSRHVPLVALVYSDSTGTLIPAGANGLSVSVSAGTVVLGGISSSSASVTGTAYATAIGTALASNSARWGYNIINHGTATVYVGYGTATSATQHLAALTQGQRLSDSGIGIYTGVLRFIGTAAGTATVTEW